MALASDGKLSLQKPGSRRARDETEVRAVVWENRPPCQLIGYADA
jgi:hypothetical protein